ncbi:dinG [Mytilus coruscus]|uniref:DinG n=1 Tax=Mytilus coruscus TaxID=42192 RepID=A0A6J8CR10_MYTCO|nr:dinG [Mytilus coruscus]
MCQNIVGSKDYVKRIKLMNAVRDNLLSDNREAVITSGSFGEGLDMKGSDLDVIYVSKKDEVYEDVKPRLNASKTYYSMKTDDVKPGCTQLLLKYTCCQSVFYFCEEINGEHYCSSALFKEMFLCGFLEKTHGPCLADNYGMVDYANCFHCKSWISTAKQWVTRSSNAWPSYDVKQ